LERKNFQPIDPFATLGIIHHAAPMAGEKINLGAGL
jgi:hypothetical protein